MSQQTQEVVEAAGAHPAAAPGSAKLTLDGKEHELPAVVGSEGEKAIDITHLRAATGYITLDPGYGNTGACESAITFIDGEKGILRYRGYPIEEIAGKTDFVDVCFLLIYGHLPTQDEIKQFRQGLTYHSLLHEDMKKFFEGFPAGAHPMAILSAMVASLSAYYPERQEEVDLNIIRLLAKVKTIAAFSHKK
ncbi:MAG TPA: citrate/2-methylcitrate synthase, partial [Thermoanaerobaculia bacterium]|nr:citrate/2-methylcitrate synthase [Thermoanaerobaculia bacterium]